MTVEDPIEYELPGVGQTQVNAIDLTFARPCAPSCARTRTSS
jgi:type II secretory ATPase GspE/PulE/Tfp pilus assembly ATPase PilB-like protein